jgi:ATP-dependent Clp protease ATP-binding subunit ClpA
MFERFTRSAEELYSLAAEERQKLGFYRVGSEMLLLGALRHPRDHISAPFQGAGLTQSAVEHEIDVLQGPTPGYLGKESPMTRNAEEILRLANAESEATSDGYISALHLALGLVTIRDSTASIILTRLSIRVGDLEKALRSPDRKRIDSIEVLQERIATIDNLIQIARSEGDKIVLAKRIKKRNQLEQTLATIISSALSEEASAGP